MLFEELLEAAVDLDRIPDEYLIAASYDAELQVWWWKQILLLFLNLLNTAPGPDFRRVPHCRLLRRRAAGGLLDQTVLSALLQFSGSCTCVKPFTALCGKIAEGIMCRSAAIAVSQRR